VEEARCFGGFAVSEWMKEMLVCLVVVECVGKL